MKKEILDFYASHGLHLNRIYARRRKRHLKAEQIYEAAEKLYPRFKEGDARPIEFAWLIWDEAEKLDGDRYHDLVASLHHLVKKEPEEERVEMKERKRKRFWRRFLEYEHHGPVI